ncbi:MAG: UPF0280 family protein [Spirochaetales bacterium]|nr:UPF0280 family protein [Spirochaetales bacterium]
MRTYERFTYKDAALRFCSPRGDLIRRELVRQRKLLDDYIRLQPQFASSLEPLELLPEAPEIARAMARAAALAGVGPMAAVAGAMAQTCAMAALAGGAEEAIVENGGDLFLASAEAVVVGLFAGDHPLSGKLALRVPPERMPLSVCSSSSYLGHSLSLGECDLATVVAPDAALADAAATLAGNLVKSLEDVEAALERVRAIPGVQGVLIVKDRRVGLAGDFPELTRVRDPKFLDKITGEFRRPERDPASGDRAGGDDGANGDDRANGDGFLEPRGGFRLPL